IDRISEALASGDLSPLMAVAVVMVIVALGFKVAAAPFHLWAPDAYQGAPAPSAVLVASGSKLAAVVLFYRLLWPGMYPLSGSASDFADVRAGWQPVVLVVAVVAMALGNIAALAQRNVRRLLAYSAIAHAGVLLLALAVAGPLGAAGLYYYALTYGLAVLGAFGVIAVLERHGTCQTLDDLAGLSRRSPFLAWCLFVFVLSLAGIPPLAGFFAKFNVFVLALRLGGLGGPLGWTALLAIALSVVGLYYYLIILKYAFVVSAAGSSEPERVRPGVGAAVALVLAAVGSVLLGVMPSLVFDAF
ncbi:MAG: NADH-quinone oxidoreductase subunit N, partial [Opitutaceae bacterium]